MKLLHLSGYPVLVLLLSSLVACSGGGGGGDGGESLPPLPSGPINSVDSCVSMEPIRLTSWTKPNACPSLVIPVQYAESYQLNGNSLYYLYDNIITGINTCSAVVLSKNFIKDSTSVFFKSLKIVGADAATFEVISELFSKDKNYVYYNKLTGGSISRIPNANPANFTVVGESYAKDDVNVFYGANIVNNADRNSIVFIADDYAKDDNYVFSAGAQAQYLNVATFADLGNGYISDNGIVYYKNSAPINNLVANEFVYVGGRYVRDNTNVFYSGQQLPSLQVSSLEYIGDQYIKDASVVFYGSRKISEADAASFTVIANTVVAKDVNYVYYSGRVHNNATPASFVHVEGRYYKDNNTVYYDQYSLDLLDPSTLIISGDFAKDAEFVYRRNGRLNCAHASTFEVLDKDLARDIYGVFSGRSRDQSADPNSINRLNNNYRHDNTRVYGGGGILPGVDPKNFRAIADSGLATDGVNVYKYGVAIVGFDVATLEVLDAKYIKDKNNVYAGGNSISSITDAANFRLLDNIYAVNSSTVFQNLNEIIGASPNSFNLLGNGYATDGTRVYYTYLRNRDEPEVIGADPASFRLLSYGYSRDDTNIYYLSQQVIGADPATFEVISSLYAKDINTIYYGGTSIVGVDPASFKVSAYYGYAANDNSSAYHSGVLLPNITINTYQVISSVHAKDDNSVYYRSTEIVGADAASFSLIPFISAFSFTRDNTSLYLYGNKVVGSDPNSLIVFDEYISKDNNNVYLRGVPIVSIIDVSSFVSLGFGLFKDASKVYYGGYSGVIEIPGADPSSFSRIDVNGISLTKDANNVYLYTAIVTGADPASFTPSNGDYYIDNDEVFYFGNRVLTPVPGADPSTLSLLKKPYYTDNDQVFRYGVALPNTDPATFDPETFDPVTVFP